MNEIVQALASASLQVAVVVACTFALRWLLGDRISPVVYGWAWSVVAVRLLVPIPIRASWAVADPGALLAGSGVIDEAPWRAGPAHLQPITEGANDDGMLVLLWSIGVVIVIGTTLVQQWRLMRSLHTRPVDDRDVVAAWHEALARSASRRAPMLRCCDGRRGPLVTGVVRPVVIVPSYLIGALSRDQWMQVFGHELAHVRRRDLWHAWLWSWAVALHWPNPLVWWARSAARRDRELAADAWCAARLATDHIELGRTLLRVAEVSLHTGSAMALAMAASSRRQMRRRILALARPSGRSIASNVIAGAVMLTSLAAFAEPALALHNADLEGPASSGVPSGWLVSGVSADSYRARVDIDVAHDGWQSARLEPIASEPAAYATLMQHVPAVALRGHRIRVTAFVRGRGIAARGDFWARIQAMDSPADGTGLGAGVCRLAGTFDWTQCAIELEVPEQAHALELGVGLGEGPGTAWIDDIELTILR